MSCPDIERIIDLALGGGLDPEVEAHTRQCAECRAELRMIAEVRNAFSPAISVPDALIDAAVDGVLETQEKQAAVARRRARWPAMAAGVLGALTVLGTVLATDSVDPTGSQWLVLYALVVGVVAGLGEMWLSRRGDPARAYG